MFFSIISVTTDAILAAARNHPEKIAGIDKMRERASAARRHLLNFCRHILKY
jgi:hypothetical protein